MKTYLQLSVKILVWINFLLSVPALFGVLIASIWLLSEPLFIVMFISLLAGIVNAVNLFRNQNSKKAWLWNFAVSLYAILLYSVVAFFTDMTFAEGYIGYYLWPVIMLLSSYYVIQNFYSYEKAKR